MTTYVKPTSKGQVTIRKTLMEHMKLRPGQRLEMRPTPDGNVLLVPEQPKHDISAIFGMLKREGDKPMTLEDMDKAVRDAVVENDRRTMSR
mgnify:CR=1 FL=1